MFKLRSVDHRREAARQGERVGDLRTSDELFVVCLFGGVIVGFVGALLADWLRPGMLELPPTVEGQAVAAEPVGTMVMEPRIDEPHSVIAAEHLEAALSSTADPPAWLASPSSWGGRR